MHMGVVRRRQSLTLRFLRRQTRGLPRLEVNHREDARLGSVTPLAMINHRRSLNLRTRQRRAADLFKARAVIGRISVIAFRVLARVTRRNPLVVFFTPYVGLLDRTIEGVEQPGGTRFPTGLLLQMITMPNTLLYGTHGTIPRRLVNGNPIANGRRKRLQVLRRDLVPLLRRGTRRFLYQLAIQHSLIFTLMTSANRPLSLLRLLGTSLEGVDRSFMLEFGSFRGWVSFSSIGPRFQTS